MSLQLEEDIKNIIKKYGFISYLSDLDICGTSSFEFKLNNIHYTFLCNVRKLIISSEPVGVSKHVGLRNYKSINRTFYEWRSFGSKLIKSHLSYYNDINGDINQEERIKLLENVGLSKMIFMLEVYPLIKELFSMIEELKEEKTISLSKGINLVPLDKDQQIAYMKKQDWYNKLLTEYTQYYQSDSKSDIADKHYQEQARLHGLKFIVR